MYDSGDIYVYFWMLLISVLLMVVASLVISFLSTVASTAVLIPILKKNKAKQMIHEDVPENHKAKSGTPTMGGIAIIIGIVFGTISVSLVAYKSIEPKLWFVMGGLLLFGLLGFIDDYSKVANKRNLGLTAGKKFLLQCLVATFLSIVYVYALDGGTSIIIPFTDNFINLGVMYIPFMVFVIVAMANSVNLTDGLDGLAAGVTFLVALFFAVVSIFFADGEISFFLSSIVGACLGFLIFNRHPAKVFMGDTGSLALGGGIAVAACVLDMELLLPIVGLIYVVEALSDIIQVASYKLRNKKRVFKMAPLHHHFELSGWSEKKVVAVFMLVTLVMAVIGWFAL